MVLRPHYHRFIIGALLLLWAIVQYASSELFFMRTSVDKAFYLERAEISPEG